MEQPQIANKHTTAREAESTALPRVNAPVPPAQMATLLESAARRGKLAGYAPRRDGGFEVTAFGEPFDHDLRGLVEPTPGGSIVRFSLHMRPKLPAFYVVLIAVSIWPGVWLTHSMLITYFSWYKIQTWWWYIPLTVVPLFWMVPRMIVRSRAAVRASALEQVEKIREAVGGRAESDPAA